MFKSILVALTTGAALVSSAHAGVLVSTYAGVVTGGVDNVGYWGLGQGASLAGQAFTAVFTLDDNTAGATVQVGPLDSHIWAYAPSNPLKATLTINGVSQDFGVTSTGGYGSYYVFNVGGGSQGFQHQTYDEVTVIDPGKTYDVFQTAIQGFGGNGFTSLSPDYRVPFSYVPDAQDVQHVDFYKLHKHWDLVSGQSQDIYDWHGDLRATLITSVYTATPVGGVPEPGAWVLMILGFAGAGAALRRRRAATA